MPIAVWSNEPTTTVRGTLTLRVMFDEPVTGFAAGDLRLRRTSDNRNYVPTSAQTTLTDLGSNLWEIEITDLVSLLGQQNNDFLVRLRANSVFFQTSQVNGPSGARDSQSFSIDTNPAPVPVAISAFANQNVTIGTDMALDINITGNPDSAWIEGNLEGFHSFWDDPTLQVRGTGTRLISNEPFTVFAKRGTDDPVTRRGSFSVLPAAPVISTVARQTLYRGGPNEIIVPISNKPALVRAKSKWFGMKYEPHSEGMRIFGDVPAAADGDFSFADGVIEVLAQTGELIDEGEIGFDVVDGIAPSWFDIPDPYLNLVGESFSLDLDVYVSGGPAPDITLVSGTIPDGLSLNADSHLLSGNFSQAGIFAPVFRAQNPSGSVDSEEINFTVVDEYTAPRFLSGMPANWLVVSATQTWDVSQFFDVGVPAGQFNAIATPRPGHGSFTVNINATTGVMSVSGVTDGDQMTCHVTVTNSEGSARSHDFLIQIVL